LKISYFLAEPLGTCGAFAAAFAGAFCGFLACGALGEAGLARGAFGSSTFACGALFPPATEPALDAFFDSPSFGGAGLFALAAFLRSTSAF